MWQAAMIFRRLIDLSLFNEITSNYPYKHLSYRSLEHLILENDYMSDFSSLCIRKHVIL